MDLSKFTKNSRDALKKAQEIAQDQNQQQLGAAHLLSALISQNEGLVVSVLEKMGVDIGRLSEKLDRIQTKGPQITGQAPMGQVYVTQELARVFSRSGKEAERMGDEYISVEHLLLALVAISSKVKETLSSCQEATAAVGSKDKSEITYSNILKVLKDIRGSARVTDPEPESQYEALKKYGRDLTELAKKEELDPVIGREEEIRRVMQVLSRRKKNNPVLIGEAGVGKTAIVEGLAQRIASGDVPDVLQDTKVVALDLGGVVAGSKFRGEFEKRIKAVLREIKEGEGDIILFMDELHTLVGAGSAEGAIDASNMLKPALARGELHAIGATTLKEYQKHVEKDPALERRFQPVKIEETSVEDTISILRGIKEKYEVHHGIRLTDAALVQAAKLSERYISGRYLPDKAVDLIDESASSLRLEIESMPDELDRRKRKVTKLEIEKRALEKEENKDAKEKLKDIKKDLEEAKEEYNELKSRWKNEKDVITSIRELKEKIDELKKEAEIAERESDYQKVAEIKYSKIPDTKKELEKKEEVLAKIQKKDPILKKEVTEEDIAKVISRWTGIPVRKMLESEKEKLARMEDELSKQVIGQDKAIKAVSNAIRRSRTDVAPPNRPIGAFMFVGPTGVGKTELVRALARFMFNDEKAMVRIDMSEYMERHAVSRLVGSPPGYVGHDEGGQLTEAVRRNPYSVVLFDEVEKAHPEVFDMFLQIMDDGRLTDAKGRTVDFKNTIIIMTSNVGTDVINKYSSLGFNTTGEEKTRSYEEMEEKLTDKIHDEFKPEFINRLDEVVVFNYLTAPQLKQIVDLEIDKVADHLSNKDLKIDVTRPAKELLAEKGYNPDYGARPLKRVIQKEVLDNIAMRIIKGEIKEGEKIKIGAREGDIVVKD